MNKMRQNIFIIGILAIGAAVFFFCRSESYGEQKTDSGIKILLDQFPAGSIIAVSSKMENSLPLQTVAFPNLAEATETNIREALKTQGVTHVLLTSQDIYPHLAIYNDSVSLIETDEGYVTLRYASRRPINPANMVKEPDDQLSAIYLCVDKTPIHFGNNLQNEIKIVGVVCEFFGKEEILRRPPKEIYFKDRCVLMKDKTCPYTVFINMPSDNPFDWAPICVQSELRNSLAIKFFLLDEPSKSFKLVCSIADKDKHIKVWKIK